MEPIINQEQFLPIIQKEPGRGGKKEGGEALQLSVGEKEERGKQSQTLYEKQI